MKDKIIFSANYMKNSWIFLLCGLVIILLSGCSQYECKTAYELSRDIRSINLNAYDAKYDPDKIQTHWHKFSFNTKQLDGESIMISSSADFCSLDNTEEVVIDYSKDDAVFSQMELYEGDDVFFTLDQPTAYFEKCEDANKGDNKYLNIKVLDMDKCNKGSTDKDKTYKALTYTKITSSYNTSHRLNIGNMIFLHGKPSILNRKKNSLYDVIIPVAESSDTTINCNKFYLQDNEEYDLDTFYVHKQCGRVCNFFLHHNGSENSSTPCIVTTAASPYKDETESKTISIGDKTQTIQVPKSKPDNLLYIQLLRAKLQVSETKSSIPLITKTAIKKDLLGNQYLIAGNYYSIPKKGRIHFETARIPGKSEGGYIIKINRDCKKRAKKSLYMYVGTEYPTLAPRAENIGKNIKKIEWEDLDLNTTFVEIDKEKLGDGDIYFGIDFSQDDAKAMENNNGFFKIEASIEKVANSSFGTIVDDVYNKFMKTLYGEKGPNGQRCQSYNSGVVCNIYNGIIKNASSQLIINSMVVLYIAILALSYMTGMAQLNATSLVISLIKISIVHQLLQPYSWEFFSSTMFGIMIDGPRQIIDALVNIPADWGSDKAGFAGLNYTMGKMILPELWYQLFSLIFTSFIGFIAFGLAVYALVQFFLAIINAIIMYFIATVYNSILVSFSPLFIPMILFKYTSKIFHSWTKIFAKNLVQILLVFAAISLLNKVQMQLLHAITNFGVCIDCISEVYLSEETGSVCALYGPIPDNFPTHTSVSFREELSATDKNYGMFGLPVGIAQLLALLISSILIRTFVKRVTGIADSIVGVYVGSLSEATSAFKQSALGLVGMDDRSIARRASIRAEQAIYGEDGTPDPKMNRNVDMNYGKKDKSSISFSNEEKNPGGSGSSIKLGQGNARNGDGSRMQFGRKLSNMPIDVISNRSSISGDSDSEYDSDDESDDGFDNDSNTNRRSVVSSQSEIDDNNNMDLLNSVDSSVNLPEESSPSNVAATNLDRNAVDTADNVSENTTDVHTSGDDDPNIQNNHVINSHDIQSNNNDVNDYQNSANNEQNPQDNSDDNGSNIQDAENNAGEGDSVSGSNTESQVDQSDDNADEDNNVSDNKSHPSLDDNSSEGLPPKKDDDDHTKRGGVGS